MNRFIQAMTKCALIVCGIAAILLLALAAAFIWIPEILMAVMRYGLAIACATMAVYFIVIIISALFSLSPKSEPKSH